MLSLKTVAGGLALAAILGLGAASPAAADAIPYPNPGTEAPANIFTAASTGTLTAYFYGSSASYDETLGITNVTTGQTISGLFPNHGTAQGTSFDFGPVTAGDTLLFLIDVANTSTRYYSNPSLNTDGYNHAYSTAYSGGNGIPAGTYVSFEDLTTPFSGGQPNYDDENFVFTNTASMSTVPLPASAPMFGAALLALGVAGYSINRKKAAKAA